MNTRYFGFWRSSDSEGELPSLPEWIDVGWLPLDRDQLVEYISKCPVAVATASIRTPCLICGTLLCSSSYQSDNLWLWPEDLAHYVREHNIKLPDALCDHIREKKYRWPEKIIVAFDQLPWPP